MIYRVMQIACVLALQCSLTSNTKRALRECVIAWMAQFKCAASSKPILSRWSGETRDKIEFTERERERGRVTNEVEANCDGRKGVGAQLERK